MAEPIREGAIVAGDFRLLRPVGAGGMGVVWIAHQLSTGIARAVKLLRPELVVDELQLERFANEARIGARIPSDHVVQVIGAGRDESTGAAWLAMELLQGISLDRYVREAGRMHPADCRLALGQICHALAAAHASGIVHRDVKPGNVFLSVPRRDGERFTVKLLDFGISKLLSPGGGHATTAALGSPAWMAPEQTEARPRISPSTDVWPLGLMAFRLLTGKHFWLGAQEHGSVSSLMREVVIEPIPAASARAAALGCADALPPGFDAWFAACVTRDTGRRFADAAQARRSMDELFGAWPSARQPPAGAFAFGLEADTAVDHGLGLPMAATVGARAAEPTRPITGPARSDAAAEPGTGIPVSFAATAGAWLTPQGSAPVPKPSTGGLGRAVIALFGLMLLVLGASAAVGVVWLVTPRANPKAATATAGATPAAPANDPLGTTLTLAAGSPEPGTHLGFFQYTDTTGSAGLDFAQAGERCHAADRWGAGSTLCNQAQWRVACRREPKIASSEAWIGSLQSNDEALVCGGRGGCDACKKVSVHDTQAARQGPCCSPAVLIRNQNPARQVSPFEPMQLTLLHAARYSTSFTSVVYFAPQVEWYGSKLTGAETIALIRDTQLKSRDDWAVDEECKATEGTGDVAVRYDCRRTVRSARQISAVTTQLELAPPAAGQAFLAYRSARDTAVLFRFAR